MDDKAVAIFISNMKKYLGDKTLILSTHQYPLLQLVDRLIVIDPNGVVVDGPKPGVLDKLKTAKNKVAAKKGVVPQNKNVIKKDVVPPDKNTIKKTVVLQNKKVVNEGVVAKNKASSEKVK